MKNLLYVCVVAGLAYAATATAAPPRYASNTCPVTLDSKKVGDEVTPGGASLRNTVAYDPATKLYHFWALAADDPNFPSAAAALGDVKHATSTDATHFVSDDFLSYGIGSASYTSFGATIDPPLDFFRAVFDTATGTWKLFNWTENVGSSVGSYDYNTSVNDLGSTAGNTSVVHQGPLNSPFAGNHVGTFGLIDNTLFLRVDSATGGVGQFAYTDAIPASTSAEQSEADLYAGTPYCWTLDPACGTTDPRIAAYVHNVGRTLAQKDGTIGTYYTFRDANSFARLDRNMWYIESSNGGTTWSAPAKVFADGANVTIDLQPLDAAASTGNFSNVDVIDEPAAERIYFSTQNAAGDFVFVSSRRIAADTIFVDGFDGCGD